MAKPFHQPGKGGGMAFFYNQIKRPYSLHELRKNRQICFILRHVSRIFAAKIKEQ